MYTSYLDFTHPYNPSTKNQKKTITFSGGNPISHNNSQGTLMKVSRDHKMTVRSIEPQVG